MKAYPDYYKNFKCICGECKHNCCIGWEIDIDADTAAYYKTVGGEMGERLKRAISDGDEPHFILGEDERCPFLNKDNLCDIIIELGEEHLCEICREHPRFYYIDNSGVTECGIGLACEAAARIIIGKTEPVLLCGGMCDTDEEIQLRNELLFLAGNRGKSIFERAADVLDRAGVALPQKSYREWAEIFLSLERLDTAWTKRLELLRDKGDTVDYSRFAEAMRKRETEYEQVLRYFIYRHVGAARGLSDAAARAAFAVLSCKMIFALGTVFFEENGHFDFEEQVELCRMYSSEIEYSEENTLCLIELLNPDF